MNKDIDWALKQKAPHTCKHVLLILANRTDKAHQCYPSLTSISEDTGMDRRTVMRSLNTLEELQLISRQSRGVQTTIYTLIVGTRRPYSAPGKGSDSEGDLVEAERPYQQGHSAPRGTAPLGAECHQGRDTAPLAVGAQRPTEPSIEPKLNPQKIYIALGEFQNARFTEQEIESLKLRLNGQLESYINRFDRWIQENKNPNGTLPAKMRKRSAYLSILNWADRDGIAGGKANGYKTREQRNIEASRKVGALLGFEDSSGV